MLQSFLLSSSKQKETLEICAVPSRLLFRCCLLFLLFLNYLFICWLRIICVVNRFVCVCFFVRRYTWRKVSGLKKLRCLDCSKQICLTDILNFNLVNFFMRNFKNISYKFLMILISSREKNLKYFQEKHKSSILKKLIIKTSNFEKNLKKILWSLIFK